MSIECPQLRLMTILMIGLRLFALSFGIGVVLLHILSGLPAPGWPLILLALALIVPRFVPTLRLLAPLALGMAWAWLHAHGQLQHDLDPLLEGRDLTLVGWVATLPEPNFKGVRFVLDVESARDGVVTTNFTGRVRLTWYRNAPPLRAGERWQLQARLKARHGFANPGGFDYESWLFRNGLGATGYVRNVPDNRRLTSAGWGIQPFRQALRERLTALLPRTPGPAWPSPSSWESAAPSPPNNGRP